MPTSLVRSALLLGLVLLASCGGSDDSSSTFTADCQKVCQTVGPLKCPMEDAASCNMMCTQTADVLPKCRSQTEALVKCEATHPAADWECDADGEASLKGQFCDAEGLALFGCAFGGS